MLRSENEYKEALKRLDKDREVILQQTTNLKGIGLNSEQIERAIQPSICSHDQLKEEVEAYEKLRRGDFDSINNLTQIGSILIGTRIALNITQQELADRLGILAPVVSRDERSEYHGVTVEKAQRVLEALGVQITISINDPLLKAV